MELKLNDKVTAIDTARRYHVLQMKKGASGTIVGIETEYGLNRTVAIEVAIVELSNGEKVKVELSNLKPYEKKVIIKIEDLSNIELLEKYQELSLTEQRGSIMTKSYQKVLADLQRCETEILNRMGANVK